MPQSRSESLIEETDYLNKSVLDSCGQLLVAAIGYFLIVVCYTAGRVRPDFVALAVSQKIGYLMGLSYLYQRLRSGRFRPQQAHSLLTVITILCLSSVTISASVGVLENFTHHISILLIAISLTSLSFGYSAGLWTCTWIAWSGCALANWTGPFLAQESMVLVSFQLVCIAIQYARVRNAQRQFRMRQELIEQSAALKIALEGAVTGRDQLDQLIEERTAQLRLAYEELHLSGQQREEIQRTSEELQEQLVQAQKMESLGRLAGGVAHDFNNLLTVILGNLELAKSMPAEDHLEFLEQAEIAAQRAGEVSSQLLAFSRKQVLKMRNLNLGATLENSVRLLERLLGEDVRLSVTTDGPALRVRGDSAQLQQVVMNLGVNARDAMPGGGTLRLTLKKVTRGSSDWALLSVSDSGHGIDPAIMPKIFEPFFTNKPFGKGTGLGLATVHGVVNQHGGEIEVTSHVDRGTTFDIYLPLVDENQGNESSTTMPALMRRPSNGNARLLVVEDDAQLRNLAVRVLTMSGYQVASADNGEKAMLLVQTNSTPLDLLVTDVVMPGMDGASLAANLRRLQPDVKVLFVSGYTDDRLAHFGVDAEGYNFLAKPYSPVALRAKVEGILKATVPGPEVYS